MSTHTSDQYEVDHGDLNPEMRSLSYEHDGTLKTLLPLASKILSSQDEQFPARLSGKKSGNTMLIAVALHPYIDSTKSDEAWINVPKELREQERVRTGLISTVATKDEVLRAGSRRGKGWSDMPQLNSQTWVADSKHSAAFQPFTPKLHTSGPEEALASFQKALLSAGLSRFKDRATELTKSSKTSETIMRGPMCDHHAKTMRRAFVEDCSRVLREIDPDTTMADRLEAVHPGCFDVPQLSTVAYMPGSNKDATSQSGMYGKPESCGIRSCSGIYQHDHPNNEVLGPLRQQVEQGTTAFTTFLDIGPAKSTGSSNSEQREYTRAIRVVPTTTGRKFDLVYPPDTKRAERDLLAVEASHIASTLNAATSSRTTGWSQRSYESIMRPSLERAIERITQTSNRQEHDRFKGLSVTLSPTTFQHIANLRKVPVVNRMNSHLGIELMATESNIPK